MVDLLKNSLRVSVFIVCMSTILARANTSKGATSVGGSLTVKGHTISAQKQLSSKEENHKKTRLVINECIQGLENAISEYEKKQEPTEEPQGKMPQNNSYGVAMASIINGVVRDPNTKKISLTCDKRDLYNGYIEYKLRKHRKGAEEIKNDQRSKCLEKAAFIFQYAIKAEEYLYGGQKPSLKEGLAEQKKMEVILNLYKKQCREEMKNKFIGKSHQKVDLENNKNLKIILIE